MRVRKPGPPEHSNLFKSLLARQSPLGDNPAFHQQYQPLPQLYRPPYQTNPYFPTAMATAPFYPPLNAMSDSAQANTYMYAQQHQPHAFPQASLSSSSSSSALMSSPSAAQSCPQPSITQEVHNSYSSAPFMMIGANTNHSSQQQPAGPTPQHHSTAGFPTPSPHAVGPDWQRNHSATHPPTHSSTASGPPSAQ